MGEYEEKVQAAIERKYGSISRMASETGIARTTIYHALERGLDNTTTKTRNAILAPLFGSEGVSYHTVSIEPDMDVDERELLTMFRAMDERGKRQLLEIAEILGK